MTLAVQTVKQFVSDSYQLVSASTPTVPLQGWDMQKGVQFLNELIAFYSSSGLLLPISQKVNFILPEAQQFITFGDPTVVPTPDVTAGRLANLENAWLELDGVDYPLIDQSRNVFFASYKYFPQLGLPRFIIIVNEVEVTNMQFYPAGSQQYNVWVYGKFQMAALTENSNMSAFPLYQIRFLRLALAKDLSIYKGRAQAWTPRLEEMYVDAKQQMESVSSFNLSIDVGNESYLNGSWRVKAGI
jgi:hypothetical protein